MTLTAFFISQIGTKGSEIRRRTDEVFNHIVTPVLEEFDIVVSRADLDPMPGPVTTQIVRSITESDLIVADLTGRNMNVGYELGIAHSFGKRLILIVDNTDGLTFDLQNERVISIGDDGKIGVSEALEVKNRLREALEVVTDEGFEPENLVTSAAGARSLDALAPDNPLASEISGLRETVENLGSLTRDVLLAVSPHEGGEELSMLKVLVEELAEGGIALPEQLEELVGENTSIRWDRWVRSLIESSKKAITRTAYYDGTEPF